MSLKDQRQLQIVLYEGAGARALSPAERYQLARTLLDKGYGLSLAVGASPVVPASGGSVLVLGRFDSGQAPQTEPGPQPARVGFYHLGNWDPATLLQSVERCRQDLGGAVAGQWLPWYPVIDYHRCTNCMQCLSFCLFGVYGVARDQKIQVQNHDACKTNCPACARVCPEAAILFPKYKAAPINGEWVQDSDVALEKLKIDISALLGGDVYSMLRQRNERARSRFSQERDSVKALEERRKCLAKLQELADVPPEVLMSLPAPEEIQKRAREAMARAREALSPERPSS